MSLVDMKCLNCGGPMTYADGHYTCSYCGALVLKIIDAKIEADVERLDAKEFEKRLEESKHAFLVRVEEGVKVLDAKTAIINRRLQNAKELIKRGAFSSVNNALEGVPDDIAAAARLRLLARFGSKDEHELSLCKCNIRCEQYRRFLELCQDEETKRTYEKIAQICENNERLDCELEQEIRVIEEMAYVGLRDEVLLYAKQTCAKFPQLCKSWAEYAKVKCKFDPVYDCTVDIEIMKKCPDFQVKLIPEEVQYRQKELAEYLDRYKKNKKSATQFHVLEFFALLFIAAGGAIAYIGGTNMESLEFLLALGIFVIVGAAILCVIFTGIRIEKKSECKKVIRHLGSGSFVNPICKQYKHYSRVMMILWCVFGVLALTGLVLLVLAFMAI